MKILGTCQRPLEKYERKQEAWLAAGVVAAAPPLLAVFPPQFSSQFSTHLEVSTPPVFFFYFFIYLSPSLSVLWNISTVCPSYNTQGAWYLPPHIVSVCAHIARLLFRLIARNVNCRERANLHK